jgi:site-specific recombinase XerD
MSSPPARGRKIAIFGGRRKAAVKAELDPEKWNLHKFRASYITKLLRGKNVDLVTLQKLVGHDSLTWTQRYWEAMTASDPSIRAVSMRRLG